MGFWESKRVTVTGGAGFLGTFVVEKLRERGCNGVFVHCTCEYHLSEIDSIPRILDIVSPTPSSTWRCQWVASGPSRGQGWRSASGTLCI